MDNNSLELLFPVTKFQTNALAEPVDFFGQKNCHFRGLEGIGENDPE